MLHWGFTGNKLFPGKHNYCGQTDVEGKSSYVLELRGVVVLEERQKPWLIRHTNATFHRHRSKQPLLLLSKRNGKTQTGQSSTLFWHCFDNYFANIGNKEGIYLGWLCKLLVKFLSWKWKLCEGHLAPPSPWKTCCWKQRVSASWGRVGSLLSLQES